MATVRYQRSTKHSKLKTVYHCKGHGRFEHENRFVGVCPDCGKTYGSERAKTFDSEQQRVKEIDKIQLN